MNVAFVAPTTGQGSVVYVQSLAKGASRTLKPVLSASGKPERIAGCDWVSNQRLVCTIYFVTSASSLLEPDVQSLAKGASRTLNPVLSASGKPERIAGCDWVSNQRLVCTIYFVTSASSLLEPVEFSRLVAVNIDATKLQLLSTRGNSYTRGIQLG